VRAAIYRSSGRRSFAIEQNEAPNPGDTLLFCAVAVVLYANTDANLTQEVGFGVHAVYLVGEICSLSGPGSS